MLGNISKTGVVDFFSFVEMKQTSLLSEPQKCPTVRKKTVFHWLLAAPIPMQSCLLALVSRRPLGLSGGTDCKTILCRKKKTKPISANSETTQNMPALWQKSTDFLSIWSAIYWVTDPRVSGSLRQGEKKNLLKDGKKYSLFKTLLRINFFF